MDVKYLSPNEVLPCSSMMRPNNQVNFGRIVLFACLHIVLLYYYILLSSFCKRVWKYWTSKMLVRHILRSLSKIKSIISTIIDYISIYIHKWGCAYSTANIRVLVFVIVITKSENMTHLQCLGLVYETLVYDVCLSMFLCSHWGWVDRTALQNTG